MSTDSKVLSERTRTWYIWPASVQYKYCAKIKNMAFSIIAREEEALTSPAKLSLIYYRSKSNSGANHPAALREFGAAKASQLKNKSWHCFLQVLQVPGLLFPEHPHTLLHWAAVSKLSSKAGGKAKAKCTAGPGRDTWQCWKNIPWTLQGTDITGI